MEYDEVLRKQREIMYEERNQIIDQDHSTDLVMQMMHSTLDRALLHYVNEDEEKMDYEPLIHYVQDIFYMKVT